MKSLFIMSLPLIFMVMLFEICFLVFSINLLLLHCDGILLILSR